MSKRSRNKMKDMKEENPLSEVVDEELEIEQDEIVSETPVFEEVTSSEVPFVEPLGSGRCPVCHLSDVTFEVGAHIQCPNCSRHVVLI